MMKKVLRCAAQGAPLGLAIGYAITILLSFFWGGGEYLAVMPAMTEAMGSEAAAVAVAYSLVLALFVYREVKFRDLPEILRQTGVTTAVVMFLIAVSSAMSWIMTISNIPQTISSGLVAITENRIVLLLIINLLLLFVGTFMDMTPAVLIFTPIFLPVVRNLGMSDIQFGIMMIANLCIGLCTPPVGSCLFLGCGIGKTSITAVTRPMLPFFGAMLFALLLITFIPALSMWLPDIAGLLK